jgi:prepilin-type N-terminal cleavage/methylation domain-containing protein
MKRGFTLIELLAVMAVIVVLAALVVGVAGNVQKAAAKNRAKVEVAALEAALELYKIDNGDYPDWPGITPGTDIYPGNPSGYDTQLTNGTGDGNRSLFEQLVGRQTLDSQVRTGTTYIEVKQGQVGTSGSNAYFVDPFGYAYGYYYNPAAVSPAAPSLFNRVAPDIWSTSGQTDTATPDSTGDEDQYAVYLNWVTNWGNE